jgi:hypothetical protein
MTKTQNKIPAKISDFTVNQSNFQFDPNKERLNDNKLTQELTLTFNTLPQTLQYPVGEEKLCAY